MQSMNHKKKSGIYIGCINDDNTIYICDSFSPLLYTCMCYISHMSFYRWGSIISILYANLNNKVHRLYQFIQGTASWINNEESTRTGSIKYFRKPELEGVLHLKGKHYLLYNTFLCQNQAVQQGTDKR